jgi:cbb3-type cytochrome oxidase subunit 3
MAGIVFPQAILLSGNLLLIGFFLFVILYILIRLFAERHKRHKQKTNGEDEEKDDLQDSS